MVPSTTTTRTLDIPSVNFSDLSAIFLLAMSAFMVYKIFGGRFRQPRIKYRPRQNPPHESFWDRKLGGNTNQN